MDEYLSQIPAVRAVYTSLYSVLDKYTFFYIW